MLWSKREHLNPSFLLWSLYSSKNLWVSLVWLCMVAIRQWFLLPCSFHPDGLLFRTWRWSCVTEVELHVGTCWGAKSAGTAFVALASCVAASRFASKHAVFKAERSFPAVFPCTEASTKVRDELRHIFWCVSLCFSMQTVKISNRSSNLGRYVNYIIVFQEFALKTIPLTVTYIHFLVNFVRFQALYFIVRQQLSGPASLRHFLKCAAIDI